MKIEWQEQIKTTLMILFTSYKFFTNYAAVDAWQVKTKLPDNLTDLDTWILSRLKQVVTEMETQMSQYRIHKAPLTIVPQGKIGYVFARDGEPLVPSQTLGRVVSSNCYQDARRFLGKVKSVSISITGQNNKCK